MTTKIIIAVGLTISDFRLKPIYLLLIAIELCGMKVDEVESCSFEQWYPEFSKVTFKSRILPLPQPVVDYLRSDGGIVLPVECDNDKLHQTNSDDWLEETSEFNENIDSDENILERPSFPEFAVSVRLALTDLGGSVIPKLNWSAPRDASWMGLANSLKCTTLSEIMLLLKSSEFVIHDLTQPYKDCDDQDNLTKDDKSYVMVLRRWSDGLNPGSEFRCFVKNNRLFAACQRDNNQHYTHIKDERQSIMRDIQTFYDEHISSKLSNSDTREKCVLKLGSHPNFVFDIFRKRKDLVRLVDFNPFGPTTDSLLFEWDELNSMPETTMNEDGNESFQFRFVENGAGIQPSGLRHYSIPTDFVDLATGSDPHKFMDFLQLQQQIQSKDGS